MTCEEFERVLPELEGGRSVEQEGHLRSCLACSSLVKDLNAISEQARLLQGSEEPSHWVWNSIEVSLRQEGLIRPSRPEHERTQVPLLNWRLRWLVPLAAALLVAFGVLMHQRPAPGPQIAVATGTVDQQANEASLMASDDQQLLNTVAQRMPSMRAAYETNLRSVNAYIRDAEQTAHSNPNEEVAQQHLMNAYEQKAMVYEMALDRSLP